MTAPPPTHLRDANTGGGNQLKIIHEQNQRVLNAPARHPFLCYFLLGEQKKVEPTDKIILPTTKEVMT